MPNPASVTFLPALVEASSSDQSVVLEPEREYTIQHMGVDNAGVDSATAIFLGFGQAAVASYAGDAAKAVLQSGKALIVGPLVSKLFFKTVSGSPTFMIVPAPKALVTR